MEPFAFRERKPTRWEANWYTLTTSPAGDQPVSASGALSDVWTTSGGAPLRMFWTIRVDAGPPMGPDEKPSAVPVGFHAGNPWPSLPATLRPSPRLRS